MIEHLINPERPYGEPEYSKFSKDAKRLKHLLHNQLGQEGQDCLSQLADTYMRQENTILRGAFAEGF